MGADNSEFAQKPWPLKQRRLRTATPKAQAGRAQAAIRILRDRSQPDPQLLLVRMQVVIPLEPETGPYMMARSKTETAATTPVHTPAPTL